VQDVEFTIEHGKLWMLQTRNAKRTAKSAIKIAVDMVNEGLISKDDAVLRVTTENVDTLLHPQFDDSALKSAEQTGTYLAKGVNASPGAAVGQVYFDADTAEKMAKEQKQDTIMVRPFTKPDDVHGMIASKGVLTSEGGATSHAAVVARQFGIPCVVGATAVKIDLERRIMTVGDKVVKEGEWISVDGTTGKVYAGKIPTTAASIEEQTELLTLLNWADEIAARPNIRVLPNGKKSRGLMVWANADYPKDARRARSYGAVGIGLCRTEHMFFETERLPIVQRMILAETIEARTAALNELLPSQRSLMICSCRSSSLGRNSCSGGSIRRIITGRPVMASNRPSKSLRWNGSSSSRAAVRSSLVLAMIMRCTIGRRLCSKNMCSVRHRPIPWAPNARARCASRG
jgi:pyruvate, orthophosphate dikinase